MRSWGPERPAERGAGGIGPGPNKVEGRDRVGREVEADRVNECPGPEPREGRGGGYQRPVGQVHGCGRLTDVIDRVYRIRRTDGEPIDHHTAERGSARLGIHKTVVVSNVRGGRITDAVGDEDETEMISRGEPRRGLENDAGLGPAS